MNLSHILITGTYDNHFNTSEEGTDFCICQRSDATHVSVYLVDVEGNAEPVKDFPLGDDPARAYVDALMLASEHAVHKDSRIIDTYQKRAGQLKDLGAAQPNIHKDGEVRKQVEQEPVAWLAKTLKGSLAGTLGLVRPYNKLNPELYEGPFPVYRHADPGEVERLTWEQIVALVNEVLGCEAHKWPMHDVGHQMTDINFNSLARIINRVQRPRPANADPGEVERLRKELEKLADDYCKRVGELIARNDQLAEAQALLREVLGCQEARHLHTKIRGVLSASAEPKPFRTPDCPECACVQDGDCLCIPSKPSAPVEIDERARFEKAVIDKAERFHPNLEQYGEHPEAEYRDPNIEWAWGLWQARAEEPKA